MAETNPTLQRIFNDMEATSIGLSSAIKTRVSQMSSQSTSSNVSSMMGMAGYMQNNAPEMMTPSFNASMAGALASAQTADWQNSPQMQGLNSDALSELKDTMTELLDRVRAGKSDFTTFADQIEKIDKATHGGSSELVSVAKALRGEGDMGGAGPMGGGMGGGVGGGSGSRWWDNGGHVGVTNQEESLNKVHSGIVNVLKGALNAGTLGLSDIAVNSYNKQKEMRENFVLQGGGYQEDLEMSRRQMNQSGRVDRIGEGHHQGLLRDQEYYNDFSQKNIEVFGTRKAAMQYGFQMQDAMGYNDRSLQRELMQGGATLGKVVTGGEQIGLDLASMARQSVSGGGELVGLDKKLYKILQGNGQQQELEDMGQNALSFSKQRNSSSLNSNIAGQVESDWRNISNIKNMGYTSGEATGMYGSMVDSVKGASQDPRRAGMLRGLFHLSTEEMLDPTSNRDSIANKMSDTSKVRQMVGGNETLFKRFLMDQNLDEQTATMLTRKEFHKEQWAAEVDRKKKLGPGTDIDTVSGKDMSPFSAEQKLKSSILSERQMQAFNSAISASVISALELQKSQNELALKTHALVTDFSSFSANFLIPMNNFFKGFNNKISAKLP